MVHPDQSRELTQRLLQGEPAYYRGGWATIVVNLGLKTPFGRWASFQQRGMQDDRWSGGHGNSRVRSGDVG